MFSELAKNEMLDGLTVDLMSLHTGDPGSAGAANEVTGGGYARQACVFAAASDGERDLNAAVNFVGPSEGAVTYIGLWENDTVDVFKGAIPVQGDTAFNFAGEFTVTTATKLALTDPD